MITKDHSHATVMSIQVHRLVAWSVDDNDSIKEV